MFLEITVLMKASKYELTDILKDLYEKKSSGDEDMKTFLVAFFGYLRSTKSFQYNYMAHMLKHQMNPVLIHTLGYIYYMTQHPLTYHPDKHR